MNNNNPSSHPSGSLVTSSSRRSAILAALALAAAGFGPTAHATLQVYEPFNYAVGAFNGQTGGTGFATGSSWTAGSSSGTFSVVALASGTLWNGTIYAVPSTGLMVGSATVGGGNTPDHLWASRALDPGVYGTFTAGNTTWISYVEAGNHNNGNANGGMIALGQGVFAHGGLGRGDTVTGGPAVGIGICNSDNNVATGTRYFGATSWNTAIKITPYTGFTYSNGGTSYIGIAKIVWGTFGGTKTRIYATAFKDTSTLSLTEAAFDAAAVYQDVDFDTSTFTKISLGGGRFEIDELRIATSFSEAIGITPAVDGPYWAPGVGGGGSGTWSTTSAVWSAAPASQGNLLQRSGVPLVFAGTYGTVTIDGTVAVDAGLTFSVSDYSLVPGNTTPQLTLTGADTTANTITVATGTASISTNVIGSTGMTKAGAGTLVLSGVNTYTGNTQLNVGTLQITDSNSLGGSNVTFGGGTLQYPPGTGTSTLDVSAKINPVTSGQPAIINTNGYDVTFATAISGSSGLTKMGGGSLTLAAAIPGGPVAASAGTLNVSSASGTLATLNVPSGGTVNLGAGAVVTVLNISGGTVNITGAGVQVGALVATGGILNTSTFTLAVTGSANINGVRLAPSGGSLTLSGANVIAPDTGNHRVITCDTGIVTMSQPGSDVLINPGLSSTGSTTPNSPGNYTLVGTDLPDAGTGFGYFHYVPVPAGDFDLKIHATKNSGNDGWNKIGVMARDSVNSNGSGNWCEMYSSSNTSFTGTGFTGDQIRDGTGPKPWLRLRKTGTTVSGFWSDDGVTYHQMGGNMTIAGWSTATPTYVGLLIAGGTMNATFTNLDIPMPDMSTTELKLTNGAKANLNFTGTARLGALYFGNDSQSDGSYGSSAASPAPGTVDNTHFDVAGIGTVTLGKVTPVITWSDPASIMAGTALSGIQLNASCPPGYGTLTYTPAAGTLLAAGSHTLHVDFTPIDPDSYNAASKEVTLVVTKQIPPITWANPAAISYGTVLGATQLNATCTVPGEMTYTPPAGTGLAVGSHTLHVAFAPTDTDNYDNASKDVTIVVNPSTGYIAWISDRGIFGPDAAPDADPDHDGLSNALELVLGSDPNPATPGATSLTGVLPAVSQTAGDLVVTFERTDLSKEMVVVTFQWSANLNFTSPTNEVAIPTAAGTTSVDDVTITVTDNSPGSDKDTIVVTVPAYKAGGGKLFGRLSATIP